jgi:hypothetical protein
MFITDRSLTSYWHNPLDLWSWNFCGWMTLNVRIHYSLNSRRTQTNAEQFCTTEQELKVHQSFHKVVCHSLHTISVGWRMLTKLSNEIICLPHILLLHNLCTPEKCKTSFWKMSPHWKTSWIPIYSAWAAQRFYGTVLPHHLCPWIMSPHWRTWWVLPKLCRGSWKAMLAYAWQKLDPF